VLKENKLKLKRFEFAVATALVVLLAGCGGGGGGGSSSGTPTGTTPPGTSTAAQFSLAGTVSGLGAGTPVTISIGSEKKIVAANGPFTLDTKLNAGATYSIEATPPAGYTCQVINGTGVIGSANVTNVTVACAPALANQVAGQIAGLSTALKEPLAITSDGAGNLFVADAGPHTVFKVNAAGQVSAFAAKTGKPGAADGTADTAQFWLGGSGGIARDAQGNLFVSDGCNGEIRKVAADGTVSTLAGQGSVACNNVTTAAATTRVDATGSAARFERPGSIVADGSGGVIVIDIAAGVPQVRKVSAAGVVTTVTYANPDPGSGVFTLQRIARGPDNTLYFSDANNRIWKDVNGTLVLVAGKLIGTGSIDGTGSAARFSAITGMVVLQNGDMYVSDLATVRKVTAAGVVTTLAGNNANRGYKDGQGTAAVFGTLLSITFDGSNLVVVDSGQEILRKISLTGVVSTLAGTPALREIIDGPGIAARFGSFSSLAAGSDGNLYTVDPASHVLRQATAAGVVKTIGGTAGTSGTADGALASATFATPQRVAAGKDGSLWIAQTKGVRRIVNNIVSTPDANVLPINLAVDPVNGDAIVVTGTNSSEVLRITKDGVRTTLVNKAQVAALFPNRTDVKFTPQSVVVDAAGNIYVADTATASVYKLSTSGQLSVFAGTPFNEAGNIDGPVNVATLGFYEIDHMTIDDQGNLYLSGQGGVRKISQTGVVSSPGFGWGNADIGAVAFANGKLYGMTRYALVQTSL
jgi:sugar lactone lactonase YvrE